MSHHDTAAEATTDYAEVLGARRTPKGVVLDVQAIYAYPDGRTYIRCDAWPKGGRMFATPAAAAAWMAQVIIGLHHESWEPDEGEWSEPA